MVPDLLQLDVVVAEPQPGELPPELLGAPAPPAVAEPPLAGAPAMPTFPPLPGVPPAASVPPDAGPAPPDAGPAPPDAGPAPPAPVPPLLAGAPALLVAAPALAGPPETEAPATFWVPPTPEGDEPFVLPQAGSSPADSAASHMADLRIMIRPPSLRVSKIRTIKAVPKSRILRQSGRKQMRAAGGLALFCTGTHKRARARFPSGADFLMVTNAVATDAAFGVRPRPLRDRRRWGHRAK